MTDIEIVMNIIINSGDSRAFAYDALRKAREGGEERDIAELLERANNSISKAHEMQTSLLNKEASGELTTISILFVHAQDHLMTAISEKNLILEMIELTTTVNALTDKINQRGHNND